MISKNHILSEIKRTADDNGGRPLGENRFEKETGIKKSDWWAKFWCRWNDAVSEAGFSPNQMQSAHEDDFLLKKILELIRKIGHFPSSAEIRFKAYQDKSFPSHNTFSRFGKKSQFIKTVLSYCEAHNETDIVLDACRIAATNSVSTQLEESDDEPTEFSFVYLMKSGKYFKIGRSKSAEKREFELKILLPERLELVHKIKTDDPIGIEKYWHDRFGDKRKSGEWFELSPSDVKVFRRRKFM